MAVKSIATGHELTGKQWSLGLEAEVLKKISVMGFMGRRSTALIQVKDELEKSPGDRVRMGLRMQDGNAPKTTGSSVEGSERTITLYYMDLLIDEFADAFRWRNVIDRQRVNFEHRDEAKAALADNLANAWDTSFFSQIAGITGGGATFDGHNTIRAPSTGRWIIPGAGTEAGLLDANVLTLDLISEAVQTAKVATPAIRPVELPGYPEPLFVCFIHPWQNYGMRQSDTRWDVTMRDAMQGGMIGNNPLLTGALGVWDGCLICENSRVPYGADQTGGGKNRRAIFCGAQAAMAAWGRIGGTPEKFRWVEKLFDYDREMGVLGGFVGGISKSFFSEETGGGGGSFDFGTIVISTATSSYET